MKARSRFFARYSGMAAGVLAVATVLTAAEIKVVTEYRYPTAYDVTPIVRTMPAGSIRIMGGIVTPTEFETREVGVYMSVYAEICRLGGEVAMTDGMKLINDNTELMLAATAGERRAVQKLLEKAASVNQQNRFGSTALMGAATGGFEKIVQALLAKGADPNIRSVNGGTALQFAAKNGHLGVVQMLVANRAAMNLGDEEGTTPLMHAIAGGYTQVAATLIAKGADIRGADHSGSTPLMLAQSKKNRDIVILLTRRGAQK